MKRGADRPTDFFRAKKSGISFPAAQGIMTHHVSERVARGGMGQSLVGALVSKRFDRQEEEEADHIGLFLMTFADFNPDEAVRLLDGLLRLLGNCRHDRCSHRN